MRLKQILQKTRRNLTNTVKAVSDIWRSPQERDLSKQTITVRPAFRRLNGGFATNEKLLKGIYTGANQEFSLSSYIATGMVDVPKNLTGIPDIKVLEGYDDTLVKALVPLLLDEYPIIIATMLTQGTAWRFPRWSDKLQRLVWEAIPDASVTALILDPETGEIAEMWIEEQIEYQTDRYSMQIATRIRHITKDTITEEWTGYKHERKQYTNVFHLMPIPFGHNCYEGEWRGHSVFSRVLRLMKSNHDITYKRDEILAMFEPKMVQGVDQVDTWVHNNTIAVGKGQADLDVFSQQLVVNQSGESTNFMFLSSDATGQHTLAIQDNLKKIMIGSGVPELFFGGLATGNYASTETDRLLALEYIKGIRRELTKATIALVNSSLEILAYVRFKRTVPKVHLTWGTLTLLSETQKAQILGSYASSMSTLLQNGNTSPEGALFLTRGLYPDYPADNPDAFMDGLNRMLTRHSSALSSPFESGDF